MKDNLRLTDVSTVEGQMVSIDLKEIPELAVDMLENGMYLIKLTKGERNSIQKFIISK